MHKHVHDVSTYNQYVESEPIKRILWIRTTVESMILRIRDEKDEMLYKGKIGVSRLLGKNRLIKSMLKTLETWEFISLEICFVTHFRKIIHVNKFLFLYILF